MSHKLGLTMCAPADDDREYFAALTVDTEVLVEPGTRCRR